MVNLVIHVVLITCLIEVERQIFANFQTELLPKISAEINANKAEPSNTQTGNRTSYHIAEEETINTSNDKVTDNFGNDRMDENVTLEVLHKELDFLTS